MKAKTDSERARDSYGCPSIATSKIRCGEMELIGSCIDYFAYRNCQSRPTPFLFALLAIWKVLEIFHWAVQHIGAPAY